jgi:hypothetical protein
MAGKSGARAVSQANLRGHLGKQGSGGQRWGEGDSDDGKPSPAPTSRSKEARRAPELVSLKSKSLSEMVRIQCAAMRTMKEEKAMRAQQSAPRTIFPSPLVKIKQLQYQLSSARLPPGGGRGGKQAAPMPTSRPPQLGPVRISSGASSISGRRCPASSKPPLTGKSLLASANQALNAAADQSVRDLDRYADRRPSSAALRMRGMHGLGT